MKVSVFGAGSWGTALAHQMARRGHDVRLWAREVEVVDGINQNHRNPVFLTDLETGDMGIFIEAVKRARSAKNYITVISPLGPLFEQTEDLTQIERAMAEAISEEFLHHRKMLEDGLRALEVEIINVGPEDILATVIKAYHMGKASGKGLI